MKVIAVFAAVLAVSSAQILYNSGAFPYAHNGFAHAGYAHAGYAHPGYAHGLGYSSVVAAPAVVSAPAVIAAPVATKTQYHSQNELGEAAFGHSEPTQGHAAVRDAAGGVRGVFSYISPEGIPFTTHYSADAQNGYRVASNALPVAPSVSIAGPVDTPEVHNAKIQHAAAHAEARSRGKRGVVSPLVSTYAAAPAFGYSTVAAAPVHYTSAVVARPAASWGYSTVEHQVAPVARHVTYAASPVHHAISPVHHAIAAPHHAVTYSAAVAPAATVIAAPAVRAATLTRVVNTPGHAVSYRVD